MTWRFLGTVVQHSRRAAPLLVPSSRSAACAIAWLIARCFLHLHLLQYIQLNLGLHDMYEEDEDEE